MELGVFAGWGRGANFGTPPDPAWTSFQQQMIDSATKSGVRSFYYPDRLEGESSAWDWSFLHPTATLLLPQGVQQVVMPDDFGGFEGPVTLVATATTAWPYEIKWTNEGNIRQMYTVSPTMTGLPRFVAPSAMKGVGPARSTQWLMLVYPQTDQEYTLQCQYYVNPDAITTGNPYSWGGPQHAETILESCKAALERSLDDSITTHAIRFKERLAASIDMDRKAKSQRTGYNRDRSDDYGGRGYNSHWFTPPSTYNGSGWD